MRTFPDGLRTAFAATVVAISFAMSANAQPSDVETPSFELLKSDGEFQVRRYEPQIHAQVTVVGSRMVAANIAFMKLASYIFAQNREEGKIAMTAPVRQQAAGEKIAMTAPVVQERAGKTNRWTVSFIMPSKWTMETLPEPASDDIRLVRQPAQKTASVRFSGRANPQLLDSQEEKLRDWIEAEGLEPSGEPFYAFYDDPSVSGPNRRNEIHVPVQ